MITSGGRPADVLLVEDDENDVLITRRGFEEAKLVLNLYHVENGQECLEFLHKERKYAGVPTPDLILLDLNMPVLDGRQVLAEIVKDEKLRKIPVVVLTTSRGEQDVLDMYQLRCSSYIVKPVDFNQFQEVIKQLRDYWFTVVVLPPKDES